MGVAMVMVTVVMVTMVMVVVVMVMVLVHYSAQMTTSSIATPTDHLATQIHMILQKLTTPYQLLWSIIPHY
jgi:hypothetical protein